MWWTGFQCQVLHPLQCNCGEFCSFVCFCLDFFSSSVLKRWRGGVSFLSNMHLDPFIFIIFIIIIVQRLATLWELFGATPGLSSTYSNSGGLAIVEMFLAVPHTCAILSCTLLDADKSSLVPGEVRLCVCCGNHCTTWAQIILFMYKSWYACMVLLCSPNSLGCI